MPAYISHLKMAQDVSENFNNIDNEYMITFSLGGDLAKYSKCRVLSHKVKQDEFIINMCDYIKNNNLLDNKYLLGALYGHICHYVMDEIVHPLIREIDKKSTKVNIKSHTLIEAYFDNYLLEKYNLKEQKLLTGKVRKIEKMIDYAYLKTYGIKNVSRSYKITKLLYSKIHLIRIFKVDIILSKLFNYRKFIKINKDNLDINEFDSQYKLSINEAINYIKNINIYLYEK
ncbi:MAG: hypothetical protein IJO57_04525 [Bacilli bacterium]|nr:hypothetical protein [Bacilli bacterium]